MRIPKIVVILFLLAFIGAFGYIFLSKKNSTNNIVTTSTGEVYRGGLSDSIFITGQASLANEQKLRFWKNGKISEIFVKVGDSVEKWRVLASLDKREFFQELKSANEKITEIQKDINKEKEKSFWTEARKMEREIASMERNLAKLEEDLQKSILNSSSNSKQKIIEINAKKRELENQKEKYKIDKETYETEFDAKDILIKSKTESANKIKDEIINYANSETITMRSLHDSVNKIFGFNWDRLSNSEKQIATYVGNENKNNRWVVQDLWRETRDLIENYNDLAFRINKNSASLDDAKWLNNESIRVYEKFLQMLDESYRTVGATTIDENNWLSKSEYDAVLNEVNSLKSNVQSKISTFKTNRDSLAIAESPEKIKASVFLDLQNKKSTLDALADSITKLEIEIKQAENDIEITEGGFVKDKSASREVLDKQSAVLDQKDAIENKKEEYQKLISGKSDTLESLLKNLKSAQDDYKKIQDREEDYEIRAPFAGTIRTIKIQIGDTLGQSDSNDAEKVILLENSDIINIKASLNQLDIIKIKLWQEASVNFDAIPDASLIGEIVEISSTPAESANSGLATYPIIIAVNREDYPIYSGMNANVNILLNESENVLLVPISAVTNDSKTGLTTVSVLKNGNFVPVEVETGKSANGEIEIISWLEEWDIYQSVDFSANTYNQSDFTNSW